MHLQTPVSQPISEFQLGAKLAILLIISQFAMALVRNSGVTVVLLNVVMLLNTLFMIQGMMDALFDYRKRFEIKGV